MVITFDFITNEKLHQTLIHNRLGNAMFLFIMFIVALNHNNKIIIKT